MGFKLSNCFWCLIIKYELEFSWSLCCPFTWQWLQSIQLIFGRPFNYQWSYPAMWLEKGVMALWVCSVGRWRQYIRIHASSNFLPTANPNSFFLPNFCIMQFRGQSSRHANCTVTLSGESTKFENCGNSIELKILLCRSSMQLPMLRIKLEV